MSNLIPNLPKLVENSELKDEILKELTSNQQKLWEKSDYIVPFIKTNSKMINSLITSIESKHVIRGFDMVNRTLAKEQKGLNIVDQKVEIKRGQRISRLIILSNDCAERFHRKVEKLLKEHYPRAFVIKIDETSINLGQTLYNTDKTIKILLLERKESVANFLLSIVQDK